MSHRRRYAVTTTRDTVVDLLALDTMNPRSVLYHLDAVRDHIELPARRRRSTARCRHSPAPPCRSHTALAVGRPATLDDAALLRGSSASIEGLSNLISDSYLR